MQNRLNYTVTEIKEKSVFDWILNNPYGISLDIEVTREKNRGGEVSVTMKNIKVAELYKEFGWSHYRDLFKIVVPYSKRDDLKTATVCALARFFTKLAKNNDCNYQYFAKERIHGLTRILEFGCLYRTVKIDIPEFPVPSEIEILRFLRENIPDSEIFAK